MYRLIVLTCLIQGLVIVYSCNDPSQKKIETITKEQADTSMPAYPSDYPDSALTAFLEQFPRATDARSDKIALTKGKSVFTLMDYVSIRDKIGKEPGFAPTAFKAILPFSDAEKRYYDLMQGLTDTCIFLANKNNFHWDARGANKPEQDGIAYLWGGKDYMKRSRASAGSNCREELHGLDCSGFIYQIFEKNHVPGLKRSADDQRRTSVLKRALLPYFKNSSTFRVRDLGKLNISEIRTGDIVYFIRNDTARHIAIALMDSNNRLSIFESLGHPKTCKRNIELGVQGIHIDARLDTLKDRTKHNYAVVRIEVRK